MVVKHGWPGWMLATVILGMFLIKINTLVYMSSDDKRHSIRALLTHNAIHGGEE